MSVVPPGFSQEPPLWQLIDPERFQELTRDLLLNEADVFAARIHGSRGQSQFGIDVIADLPDNRVDLASCKRYQKLDPRTIETASNEFFKNADHWKTFSIRRFILSTTANANDRRISDQIEKERQRFREVGIEYIVWDPATLIGHLRPHRALAQAYLGETWVDIICGADVVANRRLAESLASRLADTARVVENDANAEFQNARDLFRQGRYDEANEVLKSLNKPERFAALSTETRTRILTLYARYHLALGHLTEARQFIDQANEYPEGPATTDKAQLLLQLHESNDPSTILKFLADKTEPDYKVLYAAILLGTGELDAAAGVLRPLVQENPTAEAMRLEALVALERYDITNARAAIEKALELEHPPSESVETTLAIVNYWSASQLVLLRPRRLQWPAPIDPLFKRQDPQAQTHLRSAASGFRKVAEARPERDSFRKQLEIWEMAALQTLVTRTEPESERVALLANLLKDEPNAYSWFIAGGVEVDLQSIRASLEAKLSSGARLNISEVNTLVNAFMETGRAAEALQILDKYKDDFIRDGAFGIYVMRHTQCNTALGNFAEAKTDALSLTDSFDRFFAESIVAEAEASSAGSPTIFLEFLKEASALDTGIAVLALWGRYVNRDYRGVAIDGPALLEQVDTAEFTTLIAKCQAFSGLNLEAAATLSIGASRYPGGDLPSNLKLLRATAYFRAGEVLQAIAELLTLRTATFDIEIEERLALAYATVGDFSHIAQQARLAIDARTTEQRHLLGLAQILHDRDRALTLVLLRLIAANAIDDQIAAAYYQLCLAMDFDEGAQAAHPALSRLQSTPNPPLMPIAPSDMPTLLAKQATRIQQQMQLYMSGAIPIHFLAETNSALFLALVFDVPRRNASGVDVPAPILAMHGSRPTLYAARELSSATILYLDLTTLVLAYTIGSLDAILSCDKELVVSRHLIQALCNINLLLFSHQERLITAVKAVAELAVTTNTSAQALSIQTSDGTLYSAESLQSFLLVSAKAGIISGEAWEPAREALQIAPTVEADALPPERGSEIVLGPDAAVFLAQFGLIAPLGVAFRLSTTSETRKWTEQKQAEFGRETERKNWLRSLVDALSYSIMNGRIRLTPEPADDETQIDASIRSAGLVIMDLIRQPNQEGSASAVSFDDRFLNRSDRTGNGIPIVSIGEVLGMLRNAGVISRSEHREMLTRVRETLICFFPLSADEIVGAVEECKLDSNGNLFEARALAAIRKYLERTFEISNFAQLRPGLTSPLDESFYYKSALDALRLAKARVARTLAPAPKLRYMEGLERACRLRLAARAPWLQI